VTNNTLKQSVGSDFTFKIEKDPTVLLLSYDTKQLYRHSIVGRYKLFNSVSNMSFDVLPPDLYSTDKIQAALLAPNSRKVAFVYENNIYLMENYYDGIDTSKSITSDGQLDTIMNGITDWIYEEEILMQTRAMWWSPDSLKLAYIKFNDTNVNFFEFPIYDGSSYSTINKVRYPKPDKPNPTVSLHIFNTVNRNTIFLEVPKNVLLSFVDYYILNVGWLSNDKLIVTFINRMQNMAINSINDANNGRVLSYKEYPSAPKNKNDWFLPTGLLSSSFYQSYFQIWPYEGFKTIIRFDTRNGDAQPITSHKFDVIELLTLNEKDGFIYYSATNGDPKQKHLFRKQIFKEIIEAECLTCNISLHVEPQLPPIKQAVMIGTSDNCFYFDSSFGKNAKFYVLECLGDGVPVVKVKSIDNKTIDHIIENNDQLRDLINTKILPNKSYLRVHIDNITNSFADAELLFPPTFPKEDKTYPVLVYVYNGPSSQVVDYKFRVRQLESFICVNFDVIVAVIDGRGTDNNGDLYMKAVTRQLGKLEANDQIELAKTLQHQFYTDDDKFAIWGWVNPNFFNHFY
jgi:dipeptidyl aminopeptidase/acylaminoacyl peptidase